MDSRIISRRSAIAMLAGMIAIPTFARADDALGRQARFRAIQVDVTPLRHSGDAVSADFIARELPGFMRQYFAPYLAPGDRRAPILVARIDSVQYGVEGSAGGMFGGTSAMDYIEGAGVVIAGGRAVAAYPLTSSVMAHVDLLDVTGEAARQRTRNLAQSFAQWLPGKMGLR
jgi:hypothetical protein